METMLIGLFGSFALVSVITGIVSTISNFTYLKLLRMANKAIKEDNVRIEPFKTLDIDKFSLQLSKPVIIASISFDYESNKVVKAYISNKFEQPTFNITLTEPKELAGWSSGKIDYLDPECGSIKFVGRLVNKITYDVYGKKVEDYINTATEAMRI